MSEELEKTKMYDNVIKLLDLVTDGLVSGYQISNETEAISPQHISRTNLNRDKVKNMKYHTLKSLSDYYEDLDLDELHKSAK